MAPREEIEPGRALNVSSKPSSIALQYSDLCCCPERFRKLATYILHANMTGGRHCFFDQRWVD